MRAGGFSNPAQEVLVGVLQPSDVRAEGDGAVGTPRTMAALSLCLAELSEGSIPTRARGVGDRLERPPPRGALLDLRHLSRTRLWDDVSLTVRAEAGAAVLGVEREARRRGLWLGLLPPSVLRGSVGAWLAGPTAGARVVPGARLETAALAVTSVGAEGTVFSSRETPRSATGPDLDYIALGGGGRLAVIAEATLRLKPRPEVPPALRRWRTAGLEEAVALVACIVRKGAQPQAARLTWSTNGALLDVSFEGCRAERLAAWAEELAAGPGENRGVELLDWHARRDGLPVEANGPAPLEVWSSFETLAAVLAEAAGPAASTELHVLHLGGALATLDVGPDLRASAAAARRAGGRAIAPAEARAPLPMWASAGPAGVSAFRRLCEILDPKGILGGVA